MREYDVVELVQDLPEYGLVKGQKGTILEIYNEVDCEVEFSDCEGITIYLGSLSMNYLRVVVEIDDENFVLFENKMEDKFESIISILLEVRNIVNSPKTDIVWSRYNSVDELIKDIDDYIISLEQKRDTVFYDLEILFAPTGSLQEISIDSGWGSKFIELSQKIDKLLE